MKSQAVSCSSHQLVQSIFATAVWENWFTGTLSQLLERVAKVQRVLAFSQFGESY